MIIKKVKDASKERRRKIMVYAESGVGKTEFIGKGANHPDLKDVLLLDIDGGAATIANKDGVFVPDNKVTGIKDVEEVLWALSGKSKELASIKTLVIDGASELQKRDLQDLAEEAVNKQNARRTDKYSIEMRDYKLNTARLLSIFRHIKDLDHVNVIVTAWAKSTYPKDPTTKSEDKTLSPTAIVPDFTDAVSKVLRGYMDDVWYLFFDQKTDTRKLVFDHFGPVVAKTRNIDYAKFLLNELSVDKVKPIIENPSLASIFDAYRKFQQK